MVREAASIAPTLEFEFEFLERGCVHVAGVDEVGRGSWAGPIVAAAVMLPLTQSHVTDTFRGVCDSKQTTCERREQLFERILSHALCIGIGWSSHHVIDEMGLAYANQIALERAVMHLRTPPDAVLVDHFPLPHSSLPQRSITRGDCLSLSIAAASIVAKVVRDRWMVRCHSRHPNYGFAFHKGYGTPRHRAALSLHGPSPIHRRSFRPLSEGLK